MYSKTILKRVKEFHEDLLGKKDGKLSFYYTYHSLQYESYLKSGRPFEQVLLTIFSPIEIPKNEIKAKFGNFYIDEKNSRKVYVYKDLVIEDKLAAEDINEIKGDTEGYTEFLMISKILSYPPSGKIYLLKSDVDKVLEQVKDYFVKMHGDDGKRIYYSLYHYAEAESIKEKEKGLKELLKKNIVKNLQLRGVQVPGKLGVFYIDEEHKEIGYEFNKLKFVVQYEIEMEDFKKMENYINNHRELIPNAQGDTEDWIINIFKAPFINNAKVLISVDN
ncbi:hypothetical protein DFR86_10910 [Acidianus sulfidivorans JP7]|uniref:Uncharacterized protein n=1 Tax=Acidianus sulfidivorans JP7 TaxID=619593 RepID=A0A2U9IPU7_9CREN|nr:hypothetical protein [Acidianus sulfidivorans]AWR97994.1 hypothetical protein DFR86_10910 [Acidianus sulfidivorans JP7]